MKAYWKSFWQETQGQDLVEYALPAGLVAVAAVAQQRVRKDRDHHQLERELKAKLT